MKAGRLLLEWLLIGIGASLILIIAEQADMLERPDRLLYDLVSPFHAPPPEDRILIVAIDNEALSAIGRWPWRRQIHAEAIRKLKGAHPAAIIYDILFIEPSEDDKALVAAMTGTPPVFLPVFFDMPGPNGAPYRLLAPDQQIASAAAGLGSANLEIDSDGRARRVSLAARDGNRWIPHLAELAYRVVHGRESEAFRHETETGEAKPIAFRPVGSFRTISMAHLLYGEVPSALIRDRIVIVGASAPGLGDLYPVPDGTAALMPGAEIQANLLSSLLADRFITQTPRFWVIVVSLALLWTLLVAFWHLTPTRGLLLSLGVTAAVIAATILTLVFAGIWFPPVAALLGIVIVYPLWGWRRLSAISYFIEREIDVLLQQAGLARTVPTQRSGGDHVAESASRLHHVIAAMRRNAVEREEMLQFLSHDMRTPQAAIIALIDGNPVRHDERDGRLNMRIRRYAEITLGLADDFVQLARLERQEDAKGEPVDVADAMAQAIDVVWPQAHRQNIRIDRGQLPAGELWVAGDAAVLVRALTNLLSNAVQASQPGGTISCAVARDGTDAVASVSDQGSGLPPERREKPFARFGYSSIGAEASRTGSGLGLAFVAAAARNLGGTAAYEDNEDGGARFTMRLPLSLDMPFSPDLD
ncbi:MAG: CHASE2 domain-containing protein [Sphingobium sp.]